MIDGIDSNPPSPLPSEAGTSSPPSPVTSAAEHVFSAPAPKPSAKLQERKETVQQMHVNTKTFYQLYHLNYEDLEWINHNLFFNVWLKDWYSNLPLPEAKSIRDFTTLFNNWKTLYIIYLEAYQAALESDEGPNIRELDKLAENAEEEFKKFIIPFAGYINKAVLESTDEIKDFDQVQSVFRIYRMGQSSQSRRRRSSAPTEQLCSGIRASYKNLLLNVQIETGLSWMHQLIRACQREEGESVTAEDIARIIKNRSRYSPALQHAVSVALERIGTAKPSEAFLDYYKTYCNEETKQVIGNLKSSVNYTPAMSERIDILKKDSSIFSGTEDAILIYSVSRITDRKAFDADTVAKATASVHEFFANLLPKHHVIN